MHDALLAALDENPDDLATWDVLADWLEERGDPRAEFMRLTRDTEFPNPALPAEQQARLREAHARAQTAWFGDRDVTQEQGLVWRHGMVSSAIVDTPAAPGPRHPAFRFVEELSCRGADLAQLPMRHLRALRASGAPTGTLTLPPGMKVLTLLHSVRAERPVITGPAPETLVVDEPWLEAICDRQWLAPVQRLRIHLTTAKGLERFTAWVRQMKQAVQVNNGREWRRRKQRVRSFLERVRLLAHVSSDAEDAMRRCEDSVREQVFAWKTADRRFTWLSRRAEATPPRSLTSLRARPPHTEGLPGAPCDDTPWIQCVACTHPQVRALARDSERGAGDTPDLAVDVWCPECGCFSTLRYRESGLPWWRYGYEYDD